MRLLLRWTRFCDSECAVVGRHYISGSKFHLEEELGNPKVGRTCSFRPSAALEYHQFCICSSYNSPPWTALSFVPHYQPLADTNTSQQPWFAPHTPRRPSQYIHYEERRKQKQMRILSIANMISLTGCRVVPSRPLDCNYQLQFSLLITGPLSSSLPLLKSEVNQGANDVYRNPGTLS